MSIEFSVLSLFIQWHTQAQYQRNDANTQTQTQRNLCASYRVQSACEVVHVCTLCVCKWMVCWCEWLSGEENKATVQCTRTNTVQTQKRRTHRCYSLASVCVSTLDTVHTSTVDVQGHVCVITSMPFNEWTLWIHIITIPASIIM